MKEDPSSLLHFPVLSRADFIFLRFFGSGLGNLFFPIYRAYQAQQMQGGTLVFPQVMQLKPGPLMRGEQDARAYGDIFRTRTLSELALHVKALAMLTTQRVQYLRAYEGLGKHFHDLNPQYRSGFQAYLTQRYKHPQQLQQTLQGVRRQDICVHIRRGDFGAPHSAAAQQGAMNFLIEDEWYVRATDMARQFNPTAQVRIFTDAAHLPDALLRPLNPIEIDRSPDAFHALMKMSAHGTIVTSRSSFSLWAAYLGRSNAIINQDFDLERYMPIDGISAVRCS